MGNRKGLMVGRGRRQEGVEGEGEACVTFCIVKYDQPSIRANETLGETAERRGEGDSNEKRKKKSLSCFTFSFARDVPRNGGVLLMSFFYLFLLVCLVLLKEVKKIKRDKSLVVFLQRKLVLSLSLCVPVLLLFLHFSSPRWRPSTVREIAMWRSRPRVVSTSHRSSSMAATSNEGYQHCRRYQALSFSCAPLALFALCPSFF